MAVEEECPLANYNNDVATWNGYLVAERNLTVTAQNLRDEQQAINVAISSELDNSAASKTELAGQIASLANGTADLLNQIREGNRVLTNANAANTSARRSRDYLYAQNQVENNRKRQEMVSYFSSLIQQTKARFTDLEVLEAFLTSIEGNY